MMYDPSIWLSFIPNTSLTAGGSRSYSIGCQSSAPNKDFSISPQTSALCAAEEKLQETLTCQGTTIVYCIQQSLKCSLSYFSLPFSWVQLTQT